MARTSPNPHTLFKTEKKMCAWSLACLGNTKYTVYIYTLPISWRLMLFVSGVVLFFSLRPADLFNFLEAHGFGVTAKGRRLGSGVCFVFLRDFAIDESMMSMWQIMMVWYRHSITYAVTVQMNTRRWRCIVLMNLYVICAYINSLMVVGKTSLIFGVFKPLPFDIAKKNNRIVPVVW